MTVARYTHGYKKTTSMKNIHLLPTDKPSKLFKDLKGKLMFNNDWTEIPIGRINQNIYITDNSEIKVGDWVYHKLLKSVFKIDLKEVSQEYIEERKNILKVILTTDQGLIADGVQSIDDEFLEWFVKNASCESVEVIPSEFLADKVIYEIIIPQEEPKLNYEKLSEEFTNILNSIPKDIMLKYCEESKQPICEHIKEYGCIKDICTCNTGPKQETLKELNRLDDIEIEEMSNDWETMSQQIEPKQETVEEAVKRFTEGHDDLDSKYSWIEGFEKGTKWQQERMYENIENIWNEFIKELPPINNGSASDFLEYIKQFKKK